MHWAVLAVGCAARRDAVSRRVRGCSQKIKTSCKLQAHVTVIFFLSLSFSAVALVSCRTRGNYVKDMRVPLRVPRVRATIWSCEKEFHIAFALRLRGAVRADDDVRRDYGFIERWHHTRIRGRVAHVLLGSHTFAPYSHHIRATLAPYSFARSRTRSRT